MENKESKFKWKTKNNGTIFGLCLVGVAAFSVLLATGQVKQAHKEKEELVNEQQMVDEALQNALEEPAIGLEEALTLEDGMVLDSSDVNGMALEEASSSGIAEDGTEGETDLAGEEAALAADASGEEAALAAGASGEEAALTVGVSGEDGQAVNGAEDTVASQTVSASAADVTAEILPTVTFDESDTLSWPVAGNVVLDYSMDGSIYFPTLQQYKYNPALVIGSDEGAQVLASARGIVESIQTDEETGNTITMSLGNGYKLKYGQLQELTVAEGDVVDQGDLIGYVSQPTKYYCTEGTNLYFAMTKDEEPVDPILYLE